MKVTVSEPKSCIRILSIEIPTQDVDQAYNKKLSDYRREITLPGFRQGKTPLNIVKNRFGKTVYSRTVEDLIEQSFEDACKQHTIFPVGKGKLSDLKAEEGAPVSFSIEIEIDPTIEITEYRDMNIAAAPNKIENAEVEKAIEDLRERNAELKDVDRPAKKGDSVVIEYGSVIIDGVERKDFSNPQYPIELGSGEIKEFDKGLIGHSAGQTVDVTLNFPKDFSTKELAGKEGFFSVRIKAVKEKVIPEFTEEFLKKLGEFTTVDALSAQVRKDLEQRENERAKNEAYAKAIERLIQQNPFEVPETRIESYIDRMMEEASRYQKPGEALPSREEIAAKYRDVAIRAIKRYRIIDYIAELEKIKATQAEVDRQIELLAAVYKQPFDQLKQTLRANGTTNRIRSDIREHKTLDFLIGEYVPAPEQSEEKTQ